MIDKEKVIKSIKACANHPNHDCRSCEYRSANLWCHNDKLIDDFLTLMKEQEPKTGKWILDDDDTNSWKCSGCGDLQQIFDGTPYENGWYFCPHCGTKLEEQAVKFDD